MSIHDDFLVVAKNWVEPKSEWLWQIYRVGRRSPISQSSVPFATAELASKAGRKALKIMLSECPRD